MSMPLMLRTANRSLNSEIHMAYRTHSRCFSKVVHIPQEPYHIFSLYFLRQRHPGSSVSYKPEYRFLESYHSLVRSVSDPGRGLKGCSYCDRSHGGNRGHDHKVLRRLGR
ncbi:hypothetical protein PAXRUDRAFT_611939 [Paxillus rubicundulus Ve08.2h10]|uniref:Uncharacterized protein n=1 Tax=Paxillus rubicundulus Ve08.2h10 TaxID=930991 RepID=A0A0D0DYM4_9AGAM|nr:hypothetical protein PAXRUDRAFT_611939 [Paxillus rubicundulus Ve08.2h10]